MPDNQSRRVDLSDVLELAEAMRRDSDQPGPVILRASESRERARSWIFSDSGPEAEKRRTVLSALGLDESAFLEAAIRAGARADDGGELTGRIQAELERRVDE